MMLCTLAEFVTEAGVADPGVFGVFGEAERYEVFVVGDRDRWEVLVVVVAATECSDR
jgi:hypothetical protein